MTEQLWGVGGVVIGIATTGAATWWNERTKHNREARAVASKERKLHCEAFLASIEGELQGTLKFAEDHDDLFPGEMGYDRQPANARALLTNIELKCPPKVQSSAIELAGALEAWLWLDGNQRDIPVRPLQLHCGIPAIPVNEAAGDSSPGHILGTCVGGRYTYP